MAGVLLTIGASTMHLISAHPLLLLLLLLALHSSPSTTVNGAGSVVSYSRFWPSGDVLPPLAYASTSTPLGDLSQYAAVWYNSTDGLAGLWNLTWSPPRM